MPGVGGIELEDLAEPVDVAAAFERAEVLLQAVAPGMRRRAVSTAKLPAATARMAPCATGSSGISRKSALALPSTMRLMDEWTATLTWERTLPTAPRSWPMAACESISALARRFESSSGMNSVAASSQNRRQASSSVAGSSSSSMPSSQPT